MPSYSPKTILDLDLISSTSPAADIFVLLHKTGEERSTKLSLEDLLALAAAGGVPLLAKYADLATLETKDNTNSLLAFVPNYGIYEWVADGAVNADACIGPPVTAGASAGKWCRIIRSHPQGVAVLEYDTVSDWVLATSPHATLTLTGDSTLALHDPVVGVWQSLQVAQDGTGGWALTLPSPGLKFLNGSGWTQTTTANAVDLLEFFWDGTRYLVRTSTIS